MDLWKTEWSFIDEATHLRFHSNGWESISSNGRNNYSFNLKKTLCIVFIIYPWNKKPSTTSSRLTVWGHLLHSYFTCTLTFILFVSPSKIFEPYAKFWLTPLMELILRMKGSEQPGTEGINYFTLDLVVTMLSWSGTAIPEVSFIYYFHLCPEMQPTLNFI